MFDHAVFGVSDYASPPSFHRRQSLHLPAMVPVRRLDGADTWEFLE